MRRMGWLLLAWEDFFSFLFACLVEGNKKRGKRFFEGSTEKCENKAISWIKWDVTGGRTVVYRAALWLLLLAPKKKGKKRGWSADGKDENYISKIRGWNGWCSYRRSPLCLCLFGVEGENVCANTRASLSSEQAIIGTWEIGESVDRSRGRGRRLRWDDGECDERMLSRTREGRICSAI